MTLLNIVRNLVLIPVYLAYISTEIFGIWVAFAGAITVIALSDLGLNNLLLQKTAHLYGNKDYSALGRSVASALVIVGLVSALAFLLIWSLAPWIPGWLGAKGTSVSQLILAFRLAALEAMVMLWSFGLASILLGLQRPGMYMTGMAAGQIIGIGVTLLALRIGWGVVAIPAGMLSGTCLLFSGNLLAVWIAVRRVLPAGMLVFDWATLKDLLKSSSLLVVSRISYLFASRSYGVIVAVVLSAPLVVVLEVTRKAAIAIQDIVSRLPMSLLPGIAHLYGKREEEKWRQVTMMMLRLTVLLSLAGVGGVLLLNRQFVTLWVGKQYYGGNLLNLLICLYVIVLLLNSTAYNIIFAAGKIKTVTLASLCEAFLQVSLAIGLGYLWGLNGVALAAVLAALAALAIQGSACISLLHLNFWKARTLGRGAYLCLTGLSPLAMGCLVQEWWKPQGWMQMTYFALSYLLGGAVLLIALDGGVRHLVASFRTFKVLAPCCSMESGLAGKKEYSGNG